MVSQQMTHRERVQAALRGDPVDRPPLSLWFHFPNRDRTPEGLADATIDFQRRCDIDLVKLMPTGMYSTLDYGATIFLRADRIGTTQLATSPIKSPADWARLPVVRPDRGELAAQVQVVRRVRAALGPDVPIIETIFSPLTTANKLAGESFATHLRDATDALQKGLERFTEDTIAFGRACLAAGADGFFFASQHANSDAKLPADLFERVGVAYDLRVLAALAADKRNWCTVLHLHGNDPLFDLANRYPIHAVNWHDRETQPSIKDALTRTTRGLVAGIARGRTAGDAETLVAQARDAIAQTNGRRLIVAPDCVLPSDLSAATLQALRQAVEPA